ncbi:MAG: glycosyltransferase family 1 protein [Parcubacteria group bacterium]|jgi:glycosyltransferase involved in cell wall biosynthesis
MKIGIDARCFAQGKRTGVEEYAQKLLEAIFRNDPHNEYVLFFNALRHKNSDFSWATIFPHVSVVSFAIPNKFLNLSLWLLQYPKIDRLCGGVDLFFMPNSNFISLSRDVPLVLTVHDLSFAHYKRTFSYKRRLWHYFVNPRKLVARATHIMAVSAYTKEDLCKTYGKKKEMVAVSLNGTTSIKGLLNRNDIELIDVKRKYNLPYNFILYFGTIEPRKNIVGLVRAYEIFRKKNPHITPHLVLAGSRGWNMHTIEYAIASSCFSADIHVITDIPEEDKEAFYALATVFVYPSFFEGFGFPPLEAALCKKPIIMSHTTSMPEVVEEGVIMIDPYRTEELVAALHAVFTQKEFTQYSEKSNTATLRHKFSWDRNARDFLRVCYGGGGST